MSTTKSIQSEDLHRRDEELATEKRRRGSPLHLPNFTLDSAFHYYAIMRLLGYFYENTVTDFVRHVSGKMGAAIEPVQTVATSVTGNYSTVFEGSPHRHPPSPPRVPAGQGEKDAAGSGEGLVRPPGGVTGKALRDAYRVVSYVEAMSFMSWTAYNFYKERRETINSFSDVVAAERGLEPSSIGINKINKSENPFIVTATDKFMWQTVSRAATDSLFFAGFKHGIIGKALSITLERSVFFNRTASENLRDIVEDARWNNLGPLGKPEMVRNLVKVTQQCCKENHYSSMTQAEIKELDPVYCRLADDIMQKKLGFQEAVYLLGDVVKHPENTKQALKTLEALETKGLYGIASQKRVENGHEALPEQPVKPRHDSMSHSPSFADIVASGKKGQLLSGRPFGHIGGRMP